MMYDLAIIGGGPGGTRAAFEAAARGMKTVLIEAGSLGGTCLNAGCIPTKMLLGSTACLESFTAQKKYKAAEGEITFSLKALHDRKNRFVKGSRDALGKQLTTAGVTVLAGRATFSGPSSLAVSLADNGEQRIEFAHCIVATGSVPAAFPGLSADGVHVLTSTDFLELSQVPEDIIIIGGGVIGLEIGNIYHRLGAKIAVVEALERIAATEDEEVSLTLRKYYERNGWKFFTGKKVASVVSEGGKTALAFNDGTTLTAAKALVAVGRSYTTMELACDVASISLEKQGNIKTDAFLQAAKNIYAIGDVNGRTLLAHAADHQARYVVARIAGDMTEPYAYGAMPACIYGHMEVMRVGPTARELKQAGHAVAISRTELIANPIIQSYGTTHGFIKVAWVDGKVQSITAVGHGVSHLVTLAAIMVTEKWTKKNIHSVIFAHPTLDEALESAMLASQAVYE